MTSIRARCVLSLLLITFSQFFCTAELPANNKEPTAETGLSNREKLGDSGPHEIPAKPCIPSSDRVEYCDGKDNDCDGKIDGDCFALWKSEHRKMVFENIEGGYFTSRVWHHSVTPDATKALFLASVDKLYLVNLQNRELREVPINTEKKTLRIELHPNGTEFFALEADFSHSDGYTNHQISLYSLENVRLIRSYQLPNPPSNCTCRLPSYIDWRISVSANGQIVAVRYARELSGGLQLGIYIDTWQVETGKRLLHKEIKSIEAGWHQGQLVLNQDGSLVAQGRHPGIIEIFDTTTGKEVFRRQLPRTSSIPPKSNYELIYAPTGLAFHPVLPQIGVTVTSGCTTYIFDYKESKTLKTLYYPGSIEEINLINNCGTEFQVNLYYSPTGNWLTILNRKDAYMWKGKDYQYQGKIRIQPYPSYFHKNSSIHWNQSETKFNILYEDHFFQFTAIK